MKPPKATTAPAGTELDFLTKGELEIMGQVTSASNYVFLVELNLAGEVAHAIYKPVEGERPLWDFPHNFSKRERAAFLLSEQLGWGVIPPTVIRKGPLGVGSLQIFINANAEKNYLYFTPIDHAIYHEELEKLCALDIVMNSTDRKSEHILIDQSNKIWGIDNALTFHTDFKLRTVIWELGGKTFTKFILSDLAEFIKCPDKELVELLTPAEINAAKQRAVWLIKGKSFPEDPGERFSRPYPL